MTCYHPHHAFRSVEDGSVAFKKLGVMQEPLKLPCGTCFGCRMERGKLWALRCRHEASCWDSNVFLTLTYDDDHLPWHGSLDRSHVQGFLKRLRARIPGYEALPGSDHRPIRFFGSGEYGEKLGRPHYHLCLFNVRFTDTSKHSEKKGRKLYTSRMLEDLWPYGSHTLGLCEPGSMAYSARYASKKIFGRGLREHAYGVTNYETGEYVERVPEFAMMSNRPGIGQYWFDKFHPELLRGYVVSDGKKVSVPRFYERKLKEVYSEDVIEARERRLEVDRVKRYGPDLTDDDLEVSETVAMARKKLYTPFSTEF